MADVTRLHEKARPKPMKVIYPTEWHDKTPQPVEWLVDNCVPRKSVCLFSGDSGLGKSLLLQQLMTCVAFGMPWLGFNTRKMNAAAVFCEDPENILQWRQRDICNHYDISEGDLDGLSYIPRIGEDSIIARFNQKSNIGKETTFYEQVLTHVRDHGAQLLIIDTLAHTFSGNENIREQVTMFISCLQRIANEIDGAVILSSHPSVAAMASGSGYSGSTAWKATVRAHMYLRRPKDYDDESQDGSHDVRVLKNMKANWGPGGGVTKIRYHDGVFVVDTDQQVAVSRHSRIDKVQVESAVLSGLKFLIDKGETITTAQSGPRAFHRRAGELPSVTRYKPRDLQVAIQDLLERGRLVSVEVWSNGSFSWCIRPSDLTYHREKGTFQATGGMKPDPLREEAAMESFAAQPQPAQPAPLPAPDQLPDGRPEPPPPEEPAGGFLDIF